MGLIAYLFGKGYKGGPDFNLNRTEVLDLNGSSLEVTLPDSNIVAPSREVDSYPFREEGWFDKNCLQQNNHFFISIASGRSWAYIGPPWKVFNEPLGMLAINLWIKRAPQGYSLQGGDFHLLKKAINWDYYSFFENEKEGKYGQGKNFQARQKAIKLYGPAIERGDTHMKSRMENYLHKSTQEIPEKFEVREYGAQRWLYYALKHETSYPKHHYCQPLDDQYYLDVSFSYRLDFRKYFHIWKDDAEAAEQQMISMVRLSFPDRVESING